MEQIIERLQKEQSEDHVLSAKLRQDFFEWGERDGYEWAKSASYSDLQHALEFLICAGWFDLLHLCHPSNHDEVLGDYFSAMSERSDPRLYYKECETGDLVPNDNLRAWEEGWKAGVFKFWDEVKHRLR